MTDFSTAALNASLDAIAASIGASPILKIRTGSPPADCAAADTGTVLATMTLPSTWMAPASGASVVKNGTWEDSSADASGTPGHFRIYDSSGSTCHIQGTVGTSAADMIVITSVTSGQPYAVGMFAISTSGPGGPTGLTHYVAPPADSPSSPFDGTYAQPFAAIDDAIAVAVEGDTIVLKNGDHDDWSPTLAVFTDYVTITAETANAARLKSIYLRGCQYLKFTDLNFWQDDGVGTHASVGVEADAIISAYSDYSSGETKSHHLWFEGCAVRSHVSSSLAAWQALTTAASVDAIALNGLILTQAAQVTVLDCSVLCTVNGIQGDDGLTVENCTISGVLQDAIDHFGNATIRHNTAKNWFLSELDYHCDGIQALAGASDPQNVLVEGNTIQEWDAAPSHPLRTTIQGITSFDGPYDNLTYQNNLVLVEGYQGMAVYGGGNNVKVINNTVVSCDGGTGGFAWIAIDDGTPVTSSVYANNITNYDATTPVAGLTISSNSTVSDFATEFVDAASRDYTPSAGSGWRDNANATYAPADDLTGASRPIGAGPSRGAIEA